MQIDINTVILFDIDGTLNEPQQCVPYTVQSKLQSLARQYPVYFVTGNSYTKSVDLLNGHIGMYGGVFCNNGDELRSMRGKLIWQDTDTPSLPASLDNQLMTMLIGHDGHFANRMEWRSPRMVNYSEIGRFAPFCARINHDASWREKAVKYLSERFPDIEVCMGGAVSIDIHSKGADKSRACKYFNALGKNIIFVGDKTDIGGNDYAIKRYCTINPENVCIKSNGVSNTIDIIDEIIRKF